MTWCCMKKYKTKIKHATVEGIAHMIGEYVQMNYVDMDDQLIMAGLEEVMLIMQRKMLQPQAEYSFTFSPVQAIAISLWFSDFLDLPLTQIGNKLHTMSNEIKKLYA